METWKLLLITLLSAVLLGCIVGVLSGKHQLKRQREDYRPLLSLKERLVYTACILLGITCIVFGVRYNTPDDGVSMDGGMGMGMEGEMTPGMDGGAGVMGDVDVAVDEAWVDTPQVDIPQVDTPQDSGAIDGAADETADNNADTTESADDTTEPTASAEAEASAEAAAPAQAGARVSGGPTTDSATFEVFVQEYES